MARIYEIGIDFCDGKCAMDFHEMSNEERKEFVREHEDYVTEYTADEFFHYLNSDFIDADNNYFIFVTD